MYRCKSEKERKDYRREYYLNHLSYWKKWRAINREKVRAYSSRCNYKRRLLGFIPLNKCFNGSEAHHLDNTFVVYIPKEVHRSIYHSLETGQGMDEINKFAIDFIKVTISKLILKDWR